jgi:hypothetical protein
MHWTLRLDRWKIKMTEFYIFAGVAKAAPTIIQSMNGVFWNRIRGCQQFRVAAYFHHSKIPLGGMKMCNIINDLVLVSAIQDLARGIKSEADLSTSTWERLKITVEASLNAEMEAHLGYPKHSPTGHNSVNSRSGYGNKSLKGVHGVLGIETPRDRNGTFDPQFTRKNQTRLTHFDDKIMTLYAKGMTTRDIVDTFEEMYGVTISVTQV